jgi:hypothetical protein
VAPPARGSGGRRRQVLAFSARTPAALRRLRDKLVAHLQAAHDAGVELDKRLDAAAAAAAAAAADESTTAGAGAGTEATARAGGAAQCGFITPAAGGGATTSYGGDAGVVVAGGVGAVGVSMDPPDARQAPWDALADIAFTLQTARCAVAGPAAAVVVGGCTVDPIA